MYLVHLLLPQQNLILQQILELFYLQTSKSYRFGQPVTIILKDPDLNLKNDLVDIYFTVNDPNSENVDTVGKDGIILLEVLIKDIRYKRCMIDGIEHGGLG